MQPIHFIAGNEKRFFSFMSALDESKLALISHNDVDGITCAKIVNEVVDANFVILINYDEINEHLVTELKDKEVKKVIFTDLSINRINIIRQIESFADILIIDHHTFLEDLNSNKTVFLNTSGQGFSAGYVCYCLFSRIRELERYDWLVVCSSLADWCLESNKVWMEKVYQKYGQIYDIHDVRKGYFWETTYILSLALLYHQGREKEVYESLGHNVESISLFKNIADEVRADIKKCIEDFNAHKETIQRRYFFEFKSIFPVKALVVNELSMREPHVTFIVVERHELSCAVSARRQDGGENLPELLQRLIEGFEDSDGGGHIKSAGAHFPRKYAEEFKRRLKNA